jgi:hypothetical protein
VGKATDLEWRECTHNAEEGKRPHQFAGEQAANHERGCGCGYDDADHDPIIRGGTKQHGQGQDCCCEKRHEPRQDARFRVESQRVSQFGEMLSSKRRAKETPLDLSIAKAQDLDGVSSRLSIFSISCLVASR